MQPQPARCAAVNNELLAPQQITNPCASAGSTSTSDCGSVPVSAEGRAVTVASGWQANGRLPPLRSRLPLRGLTRLAFSDWFGFCPFNGGRLELSWVFDGSLRFASSAAICAVRPCTYVHSARIKASFSAWLRWLRSGSWGTPAFRLDSTVTVSSDFSRPVSGGLNYLSRCGVIGG